jgi:hypothetical protein
MRLVHVNGKLEKSNVPDVDRTTAQAIMGINSQTVHCML